MSILYRDGDYKNRQGVYIENGDFSVHVSGASARNVRVVFDKSHSFGYRVRIALKRFNQLLDADIASDMPLSEYLKLVDTHIEDERITRELAG